MKNSWRFFKNTDCQFYPCHKGIDEINCLFCYCPLYDMDCPGTYYYKEKPGGKRIKVCTDCTFPHRAENYDRVIQLLRERSK